MQKIILDFLNYFKIYGYIEHQPVKISSGIDPSVYFIGSHISVLKPYFINENIPTTGYVISQPCIRTHNLKHYNDVNFCPSWGSYFKSLGLLTRPENLEIIIKQVYDFLLHKLKIKSNDIRIRINSIDTDLMSVATHIFDRKILELDTMPDSCYRHKLGIEGVWGRNFNIALRDYNKESFSDIGNVIILENKNKQLGVEIALGTSTIIKQIYGLNHVMDCYPVLKVEKYISNINLQIKLKDLIVTIMALYNEGLEPSNKKITNRLMKKYMLMLKDSVYNNLSHKNFYSILKQYERLEYGSNDISKAIITYIYDSKNNIPCNKKERE